MKHEDKDKGSHRVGTGAGAVGGAATGAVVGGAVGGPVGAAVGGVGGAAAGAAIGHGIAAAIDPSAEESYWRENYKSRNYVDSSLAYDEYAPAYRYGWESYGRYANRKFDDVANDLERGWDKVKGKSKLTWNQAKMATRDAWHRVEKLLPGDFDKDGH